MYRTFNTLYIDEAQFKTELKSYLKVYIKWKTCHWLHNRLIKKYENWLNLNSEFEIPTIVQASTNNKIPGRLQKKTLKQGR